MKSIIWQEKIKEGLNIVEKITGKSLTLPILNTILVKTEKNFLNLSATDLELGINWWILAKNEKEGEIAVPTSTLTSFFVLLPNKQIIIQKNDNFLDIECENYKTQIKGFPADDFPIIPNIEKNDFIEIEAQPFCQGLEQVVDMAGVYQTRPEISGIYFSLQKSTLKIAATDSFRLAEKTFFLEKLSSSSKDMEKNRTFIFPQKTAREVINIFGGKQGKMAVYFSTNQILFEKQMAETSHPQVQLVSRLIDGEYPAYQEIIPKKYETQIILNRSAFLNQIKIAAIFSGKVSEIKFKIDPGKDKMEIFSQNPDLGEHRSFLNGKVKGDALEIAFNQKFLADGLLNIKSSEVVFELNKEEGPAVLKPVGDTSYIYVVMPIKAA